jgi:uncharacterized protein YdaU (DUF1376 family)
MSTDRWTVSQVGAYHRLLTSQWINGPLPNSISDLARIAGVDHRNMKKMWDSVIGKKFTLVDAGSLHKSVSVETENPRQVDTAKVYINKRLETIRNEQLEYREKQSELGKIGYKIKVENQKKKVKI